MFQKVLEPGVYRVTELAEILNVSRTTINAYIERFGLETTTLIHNNKAVKGVVLTDETLQKVLSFTDTISSNGYETPDERVAEPLSKPDIKPGTSSVDTLALIEELRAAEVRAARLEGELARTDEMIALLKQTNNTLEKTLNAHLLLEGKRQDVKPVETIQMVPASPPGETTKPGMWEKFKRVFGA